MRSKTKERDYQSACRMQRPTDSTRGSHPILQTPFSGTHYPRIVTGITSNYNSAIPIACPKASVGNADFRMLLILVHSPLLKESQLVSIPPLTYMLKFSGSSDLIASFCSNAISQDPEATALQALATRTCHLQRTAKRLRQGAPLERQWRTPTTVLPQ